MLLKILWEGIRPSWWISNKFQIPMFRYAFMTCRLHVLNMFNEMIIMVGPS